MNLEFSVQFSPEFIEKLRIFNDSLIAFSQSMEQVSNIAIQTANKLYSAIYNIYLVSGAKYGENHEGMMRWYEELPKEVTEE